MSAPRLLELEIPPGVVKTRSGEGAEGRWVDALNVEFINGKPQKRAGHEALNSTLMDGVARGMRAWTALDSGQLYMVGTTSGLYGSTDGVEPVLITPVIPQVVGTDVLSTVAGSATLTLNSDLDLAAGTSSLANNPFTTTNGSPVVTVADTLHGIPDGNIAVLAGATAVGGITPAGAYVITLINANSYTIRHGSNASSGATGGGAAVVRTKPSVKFQIGKPVKLYVAGPSSPGGLTIGEDWVVIGAVDAGTIKLFPADETGSLGSNPFTTTNGSAVVTVAHAAHGKEDGARVAYVDAVAFNSVRVAGEYAIQYIDANSFSITVTNNASASSSGGGAAVRYFWGEPATTTVTSGGGKIGYTVQYTNALTVIGSSTAVSLNGDVDIVGVSIGDTMVFSGLPIIAGVDLNGRRTITAGNEINTFSFVSPGVFNTTVLNTGGDFLVEFESAGMPVDAVPGVSEAGHWSMDRVGEDGIASRLNGPVYYWDSSVGGRAVIIGNAPPTMRFAFMTDERMLHCLGINDDPLVMGWSDQDDINNWTDASTTTANTSRRVQDGSMLIAGTPVGGGMNLIWTDTAVIRHQYTGSRFIYDTKTDKTNAGLIGPHAFCRTPSGVFWISSSKFKMWNGFTQDVPNALDVEDWFFRQMNRDQQAKCFAVYNPVKNSIDFHQVITGETEPTVYVTVNLADFSWVNGIESRTAGAAFSAGSQNPVKVQSGQIYKHEIGLNDNGSAMNTYLTMAPLEAAKGAWVEITGLDPDMKRQVGDVVLTVNTYDRFPGAIVDTEVVTISATDEMTDLRSSGRHFDATFSQELLDGDWAIDTPDAELLMGGKRR